MSFSVTYGDIIYIEANLNNTTNEDFSTKIITTNSFFDKHLFATPKKEFKISKSSFLNSLFVILPGLLDNQDEKNLIKRLEIDIDLFPSSNNTIDTSSCPLSKNNNSYNYIF